MSRQRVFQSIVALVVTGHVAAAQMQVARQRAVYVPPIAMTSFTPYVAFGSLGGTPVNLSLVAVSFNSTARQDGHIMFQLDQKSGAYLNSPVAVPNGTYSVRFDFSSANQPAVVTITRGASTVIATCPLVPGFNKIQSCDSGAFVIGDGKLDLALTMVQGYQAALAKVTVVHVK